MNVTCSAVVRGQVIESDLVEFRGRGDDFSFSSPDPRILIDRIVSRPAQLADLQKLSFDEILDYLEALGQRLDVATNTHLQLARELTYLAAPTAPSIIDTFYSQVPQLFRRDYVREVAEKTVGMRYLDGWAEEQLRDGTRFSIRAFGSRCVHVVAGNSPLISAATLLRSAITRSDCIIKTPSNDPFTAPAFGKTMVDMAPDHPITRHFAALYWRGGDAEIESRLYQPKNVEKIIAWGGFASVKHVTKFIQPGLELISLDPKSSISVIDARAIADEATLLSVASRLAVDVAGFNQIGCTNARVVYVITGDDNEAKDTLDRLAESLYRAIVDMPPWLSTPAKAYDNELRSHIAPLRDDDEWFKVIGGEEDEGCVIVSSESEPVDFAALLGGRTANLVPLKSVDDLSRFVDAYTQTVGVYPESLKRDIVDTLPLYGAQRFVSLGYAIHVDLAMPQDALEPSRRMCKWIVDLCADVENPTDGHEGGAARATGAQFYEQAVFAN